MKYLIIGLGNVGQEYANTRHNIGFEILDYMVEKQPEKFKLDRHAYVCTTKYKARQLILIKPTTFMNLSGKAVHYWMQQENISIENILVLVDDLALPFGALRLRGSGSDAGHNGLKDIENTLQNKNYARLRFGIGNNFTKGNQADFVLSKFNTEEKNELDKKLDTCIDLIHSFCFAGLQNTMNTFNKK